jgi:hypothetical protein
MGARTEQQVVPEAVVAHGLGMASSGVNGVIERWGAASTTATVIPHPSMRDRGGL